MNLRLAIALCLAALLWARAAFAQDVSLGYSGLPYKASGEQNTGIQVSDGVLMHVGAGAEVGYDTNVFYQDTNKTASGLVRSTIFADVSNTSRTGAAPTGLSFGARAGLQYRYYTSGTTLVAPYQHALMPSAGLSLGSTLSATVSVGLADAFIRLEDPPYNPGQAAISRDNNQLSAELRWGPGGGRLVTMLRYSNMVDIFENQDLSYANSLTNQLMLDVSWKWLPKTAVFVQGRVNYITYLNSDRATLNLKYTSYPVFVLTGLRGLITEKTSAVVSFGYQNAFYSSGATTGGLWGSTYLELQLTYRPTLLSRVVLGTLHTFENSVISAFYYNDAFYASYVHQIAGRLALDISGRYNHRNYQGFRPPVAGGVTAGPSVPRVDNFFVAGATLDYFVRNWAYAGVGYSLTANLSDYIMMNPLGGTSSVEYVKQQVFARLGVTY
jgi:hypothetical protein